MSRWRVLTVSASMFLTGCGASVQVGLANAPRLGGTGLVEARGHDVVADDGEACEGEHVPVSTRAALAGCTVEERETASVRAASIQRASSPRGALVVRWLQRFYAAWACSPPPATVAAVAWAVPLAPSCSP